MSKEIKSSLMVLSIGIVLVFGIIIGFIDKNNFINEGERTEAVVTEINRNRRGNNNRRNYAYVEFFVENQQISGRINNFGPFMEVGQTVIVYYSPENPSDVILQIERGVLFAFTAALIMGACTIIYGSKTLISLSKKIKHNKEIKSYNKTIQAKITSVNKDTTWSINDVHPYTLEATYRDPINGKQYKFKSDNIWFDIENVLEELKITEVPVFVNPRNYEEYVVDVDAINHYFIRS